MNIQLIQPEDISNIWSIRSNAIQSECRSHYTKKEVDAWASSSMPNNFSEYVMKASGKKVVIHNKIAGFGCINRNMGILESLFISGEFCHKGIGSQLLDHLEEEARKAKHTELCLTSSFNAIPFYQVKGYRVKETSSFALACGVKLECMKMQKLL